MATVEVDLTRAAVIKRIKAALERRSGKAWSVTGGRGTAYGWLRIDAPPSRQTWVYAPVEEFIEPRERNEEREEPGNPLAHMGPLDRRELAKLLGLDLVHTQGVSIPAGHDYYREYIDRAEGRTPSVLGSPYWD